MLKRKKYLGIVAGFLCAMLTSVSVFAAEPSAVAKIPAEQRFEIQSGQEAESTFQYILEAVDDKAPMPENSKEGSYTFSMTGTQTLYLDGITYTSPGIYRYVAYQIVEEPREGYQYDNSRYQVDVYVKNSAGSGLAAEIVIQNENGEKCESMVFSNRFKADIGTDQPKGGGGQTGTDSVKTGDNTQTGWWLIVLAVSGASVVTLSRYLEIWPAFRKRKVSNKQQQEDNIIE